MITIVKLLYFSKGLGVPYVEAENKLSLSDLWACCGLELIAHQHSGPCFMGIDVGTHLHVVIGCKPNSHAKKIVFIGRFSDFHDIFDLAIRMNVQCVVIDALPETRKAREFQQRTRFPVFLAYYNEHQKHDLAWDAQKGIVKVNRTEILDATHHMVTTPGQFILPRRGSEELEVYMQEMTNMAKVLEEDDDTGSREYHYRKLGPDHYRHATAYALMASERVGVHDPSVDRFGRRAKCAWEEAWNDEGYRVKHWLAW